MKTKLKHLLTAVLAAAMLLNPLTSMQVSAAEGTGEPIYTFNEEKTGTLYGRLFNYYSTETHIKDYAGYFHIPMVYSNLDEGVTYENSENEQFYQSLKTLYDQVKPLRDKYDKYSNGADWTQTDIETYKNLHNQFYQILIDQGHYGMTANATLQDWIAMDASTWFPITEEGEENNLIFIFSSGSITVPNELSYVNMPKYYREGYSLASLYMTNPYYGPGAMYFDTRAYFQPLYLEPIWVKNGVTVAKVNELSVAQELEVGSLLYSTVIDNGTSPSNVGKPFVYTKITSNGSELYQKIEEPAAKSESSSQYMNLNIARLTDNYNGFPVLGWKVASITVGGDNVTATSDWGANTYTQTNSKAVSASVTSVGSVSYSYVQDTYMIEVEPILDIVLSPPSVSMNGYDMVLQPKTPTSSTGTADYSSLTDKLVNYFYVTTDTTKTVDQIKADDSIVFTEDNACANKTLAVGNTYRVFTYSVYNGDNGIEIASSDIGYTDITVNDSYTISLNANGGQCATPSITVTINSTYGTLPTPTRSGYTFNGWYTALTGGIKITANTTKTVAGNETLYAIWTQNLVPNPTPASAPEEPITLEQQEMENVKTQDAYNPIPYIIMLGIGIVMIEVGTITKKKNYKE